jgi:GT2 family glycosyltransferase
MKIKLMIYSQKLISHLNIYNTDLVREIGGFRDGLDGSQDYDLALRMIERMEPNQVHHIPRVLYHWRIHNESTAQGLEAKPYAMLAGERALNEHFQRQGMDATAERMIFGYRVRYALPDSPPTVSLIIPTRNGVHLLRQCVDSVLEKTNYPNYEILIVDNGSDDHETLDYLKSLETDSRIRVLQGHGPFNYSALNNSTVKESRGELVGLVNNDISVISPEWLSEMVSLAIQPGVGAVGASLWYPNDTLQHGGVILGIGGCGSHSHKGFPKGCHGYFGRMGLISGFSAVTGACLIIKKSIYEEVGGLNETDLPVAFNDTDFCLRIREAGYRNVWTPYAELYHHESASRGSEDLPEKQARFSKEVHYMLQRWGGLLLYDPAYNPNLTLNYEDFSLAWPPRVEPLQES